MSSLGRELVEHCETIVQRWYDAWSASVHPHGGVGEVALKDHLAMQLRLVGEQLLDPSRAESTVDMWKERARLEPEARVLQEIPIEEVVQEYRLAVDTVRDWIEERHVDVPFAEYSFFYGAFFELAAESVRRYARFQNERVRQERAEYLASVMHQLRTPMSSLTAQVELLASSSRPPDGAALGRLRRSLGRLRLLVDGVLRTERYEASELPVRALLVEPARLIDEIVVDHAVDATRKGIEVRSEVSRELRMYVDPDLFVDAIGNLVQNAVKYTASGAVTLSAVEEADAVVFKVRDTGPGIAPQLQTRLFREVQPGAAGGAGIGLRIAHRACAAQGGEIGVVSAPDEGTEFWIRLPRFVSSRGPSQGEETAPTHH